MNKEIERACRGSGSVADSLGCERSMPITHCRAGIFRSLKFKVRGSWMVLICLFMSCQKDKKEYDAAPHLEFVSVTPTSVIQNKDSLTFTIKYIDGDGDLGENSPGVKNLFLTDNRINIAYPYRVQQLAPSGSSIAIKGTLNFVLRNLSLTDSVSQQTTTFSIYITDRAGHQSNTVSSSAVTISK